MNGYNYNPYAMYQQDTMQLQERLNQLQQQYKPQNNVNWVQVTGIDGARNQIVQPNTTVWMMDNNKPCFYVKSVDNMGSASFKAFRFEEIPPESTQGTNRETNYDNRYVTREEFQKLLERLGEQPESEGNNE